MSINQIIQFLVIADECRSAEEVTAELEKLLNHYHFDYYGVVRQPKPNENPMELVLMGRWPERWPETYIAKKFVLIDPTIRYLGQAQRGFRWRDTVSIFRADPHRKRMERMMMESLRFGLEDGVHISGARAQRAARQHDSGWKADRSFARRNDAF